jgi:hypothetical protein
MESLSNEYKDTNLRFFAMHPASVLTRLGNISEVTDPEILEKAPAMKQMLSNFFTILQDGVGLPAYTTLFLAHPDGRADPLKGRYIDANHDLGEILKRIDIVREKRLYSLKADMFVTEYDLRLREILRQREKENAKT